MTHLRRIMLEELQRRHYSQATTQRYIRFVERFAQHFHSAPDRLGRQHIREYQTQLFTVQKLSPGTVTNYLCALRFFYIQTLKKPWSCGVVGRLQAADSRNFRSSRYWRSYSRHRWPSGGHRAKVPPTARQVHLRRAC